MQAQYFFMTSLPTTDTLGEAPPMSLEGLRERAADEPGVGEIVDAVLLEHDLLLRQSALAGETETIEPVVLTVGQGRGEEPLPEHLQGEADAEQNRPIGGDAIWEAYFRHVADVAERTGCEFLRRWVGFEVALRNGLVASRAKTLGLAAEGYYVATELADEGAEIDAIIAAWSAAGDPLAAMKALDEGRWDWLRRNGAWFSFRGDEAAAYARGLVLLHRWQKLSQP